MKYTVSARSLQLHTGVLVLTSAQAGPRAHNLKELGRGRYEVLRPVEFKQGEQIGYEGELPKALALVLDDTAKKSKAAKANAPAADDADAAEAGE